MTTLRIRLGIGEKFRRFALFEIAFLIAYRFGMSFSQEFAAPFWFPDSILLAALLVSRKRDWLLYLLGTVPIRLFLFAGGLPFWFLLAAWVNDSLKALLSAWLLRSSSRPPVWFENLRDFSQFLLIAALLSPGLSALAGATSRLYFGDAFGVALKNWFLGMRLRALS